MRRPPNSPAGQALPLAAGASMRYPCPRMHRIRSALPRGLLPPLLAALALRVFLVLWVRNITFDSEQFLAIARNLAQHGAFSASLNPPLEPTMVRPPGYPALLAAIFALFGENLLLVTLFQAALDTATVGVVYAIARHLALRKPLIAAWIAALCPFTAIYTTFLLAETLSIFFTSLSLLLLVLTARRPRISMALACGASFGALILIRPDFGLFPPIAFLFWLLIRRSRPHFIRLAACASIACAAVFGPWIGRNAVVLGEITIANRILAARPGFERLEPKGFWSWFRTWADGIHDLQATASPYLAGAWDLVQIPERATASPDEKRALDALLARLKERPNDPSAMMEIDADLKHLAEMHAAKAPLQTHFIVPAKRAAALWINGRTSGFPLPSAAEIAEGKASPLAALVKIGLIGANFGILILAAIGVIALRKAPHKGAVLALTIGLVAYRTIFHALYGAADPRYVISAFPALFLLGSQASSSVARFRLRRRLR